MKKILAAFFAISMFSATAYADQVIRLIPGHNIVSLNIAPGFQYFRENEIRGPHVPLIINEIDQMLRPVLVVSQVGQFFVPRLNFCNIPYWNLTQAYFVFGDIEAEFQIEGEFRAPDELIDIGRGWNYIPYLPTYGLNASFDNMDALGDAADLIRLAYDSEGNFYLPEYEFSNMGYWRPGRGYGVNAIEDLEFRYPENPNELLREFDRGDHWTRPRGSRYPMFVLLNEIAGIRHSEGDQIKAFNRNGTVVGVGTVIDDRCGFSIWGENQDIQGDDGMAPNDEFSLVYWSERQGEELEIEVDEVLAGRMPFTAHSMAVANVSVVGGRMHDIGRLELEVGWNLVSINFMPVGDFQLEDPLHYNLEGLFQHLDDENGMEIERVVDGRGRFWSTDFDFNSIPFWDLHQALKFKLRSPVSIEWEADPIDPAMEIPLAEGWNMTAYFPEVELSADSPDFYVLSNIIDDVIVAKNGSGDFMIPSRGFSNMPAWAPGHGYQIKTTRAVNLVYPEPRDEVAAIRAIGDHFPPANSLESNMSLLVEAISGISPDPRDQIAAYNPAGELTGVGNNNGGKFGIAVWGNENQAGQPVTLRYWSESLGREIDLSTTEIKWQVDGVEIVSAVIAELIPATVDLVSVYPNPFNNQLTITYASKDGVKLKSLNIFATDGKEVADLTQNLASSSGRTIWNADGLPAGVYIVRHNTSTSTLSQKVVLMR